MGWLGKIIGGAIGFAIGGPIGGAIGAGLGHAADKTDGRESDDDQPKKAAEPIQRHEVEDTHSSPGGISEEEFDEVMTDIENYDRAVENRDRGAYIPEPDGSREWLENHGPICGHEIPAVRCNVCRELYDLD